MSQGMSKNVCHLRKMNCINDTKTITTIMSLNNDVLCNIVHHLPVESMLNLVAANKRFYENREAFIASNKIVIKFEKTMHMPYLNTLYNSHIDSIDYDSVKLRDKLTNITPESIYNTQMLISYVVKMDDIISYGKCSYELFDYMEAVMKYKYKFRYMPKIYTMYCGTIYSKSWWKIKINLYDIFDCIYLTKQRKYKQLQQTLDGMQMGKTENIDGFLVTFSLLMDCVNMNYDNKARAVVTYIIYKYIHHSFDYMKEVKRPLIDAIINKCDKFVDSILNKIKMPKYMKEMITKKILEVNEMLLGI